MFLLFANNFKSHSARRYACTCRAVIEERVVHIFYTLGLRISHDHIEGLSKNMFFSTGYTNTF